MFHLKKYHTIGVELSRLKLLTAQKLVPVCGHILMDKQKENKS